MSIVSLALAKEFLKISHDKEDNVIQILIDGAEEWVGDFCGVKLEDGALPTITENISGGLHNLRPNWHPIVTVASVTNRDLTDGDVSSTLWRYNKHRIWFINGGMWSPGTDLFTVVYTAGYTTSTIPAGYDKRGGVETERVAGFTEQWGDLLQSDEAKKLRAYRFNGVFS